MSGLRGRAATGYPAGLMHRLPVAGRVALALVLVATFVATPVPALGVTECTGWKSVTSPPDTIRVYRFATDTVETVPFRTYVETVMAAEWGPTNPPETLEAGAVAVKQYGWYYAMHWRSYSSDGACFDVFDSSVDQVYDPEDRPPLTAHRAAVAASWSTTLRKSGRFFLTTYNGDPSLETCGEGSTGWKLWQQGAADCGRKGWLMEAILRAYYEPYLEVITLGDHDLTGDRRGDGGVFSPGATAGGFRATIYTSLGNGLRALAPDDVPIAPSQILDRVVADLNGDGRQDVALLETSSLGPRIRLLRATGGGFRDPVTWWRSWEDGPAVDPVGLQLAAGDYDADGREDLGLVARDPADTTRAILYWLRATGSGLAAAEAIWQGPLNLKRAEVYGGDFTGDGRADLAALADRGANGLAFLVVPSGRGGAGLGKRQSWLLDGDLTRPEVIPVQSDQDGDGRDDLVLFTRTGESGATAYWYEATGTAFVKRTAWQNAITFWWARSKVGAADLDGDGRGDLLVFYDYSTYPSGGTGLYAFLSRGATYKPALWLADSTLDWADADPF